MKLIYIFVVLNVYMINSFTNSNSPKTSVVSPNRESIKPLVVGDSYYMKTIIFNGYTLDVYEDGKIFKHEREVVIKCGKTRVYKAHFIKEHDNGHGYKAIHFWVNKTYKHEYVHRIVAITYIPNPNNYLEVNHIDGNRSNNNVSNLEWCDRKYNVNDYVKKGRGFYADTKVCQFDLMNNFIKEHNSIALAGKDIGCTGENISMCLKGKSKTAKGYLWKYSENQSTHKSVFKNLNINE